MVFNNASTTTQQGDVGEARAIYEFVRLGLIVSKPINDKAKYDLIIDDGINLQRVQVKTTSNKCDEQGAVYEARLSSSYANRNKSNERVRQDGDYEILFILTEKNECWAIPVAELGNTRSAVRVGTPKYAKYKLED